MNAFLAALAILLTLVGGGDHAHRTHRVAVVRTFQLPAGQGHARFSFRVHARYPVSAHLVVSRGAIVRVHARSANGYEQLEVWTRPWRPWGQGGWQDGCRHAGQHDFCVQLFERCPLSDSRWRGVVHKTSAGSAFVRVRFVFGR